MPNFTCKNCKKDKDEELLCWGCDKCPPCCDCDRDAEDTSCTCP